MTGASNQLISVSPDELKFQFELEKQSYCDLKVSNTTENNVAFKVKTTSPKKYFVRPNTGVIQPWDSCFIRGAPLELAILFRHVCSYRLNI
nr:vesicle-associated protein 2-1-like [Ipomoea batatas]